MHPTLSSFCLTPARIFIIALLLMSQAAFAQGKTQYNTYLSVQSEKGTPVQTPTKHFDCTDKIFAVIEVESQDKDAVKEHLLIVKWFNPGDKLEQKTRYEFTSFGKGTRLWAWLKLSAPSGASIGKIFDPAFGMGEFIGQWIAQVEIDGKKIDKHQFDVLC